MEHDRPVTVLVVDDHESFRSALSDIIAVMDGFGLAGQVPSGEAALEVVAELRPRMVIIDRRMPGIGGVEVTRLLTMHHPDIVVVLVSVDEPSDQLRQSCGAAAFVRKQQLSSRLLQELWREHGRRSSSRDV